MHASRELACRVLSDAQRKQFVSDRFVKLESAFPREIAAEAREILRPAPFELTRSDGDYSLVEQSIRIGLSDRRAA